MQNVIVKALEHQHVDIWPLSMEWTSVKTSDKWHRDAVVPIAVQVSALERFYRFFWRNKGDVYHVLWDLTRCVGKLCRHVWFQGRPECHYSTCFHALPHQTSVRALF